MFETTPSLAQNISTSFLTFSSLAQYAGGFRFLLVVAVVALVVVVVAVAAGVVVALRPGTEGRTYLTPIAARPPPLLFSSDLH